MQAAAISNIYACVAEYRLDGDDAALDNPLSVPKRGEPETIDIFWARLAGYFFGSVQ